MSWVKRLAGVFLGNASSPASRKRGASALRGRRVVVEALEDRRLLSVGAAGAGDYDFGDLPDNYGTTLAADGARHQAVGPMLGASRDGEADGAPTVGADGDDASGAADEDGVVFGSIRVGQLDAIVTVNVQNAPTGAKLDAWIDFNGDGSFGGAGEQIADTVGVVEGDNVVEFDVPSWAVSGETYSRFRLSSAGDLRPKEDAFDGEVEDCRVTLDAPASVGAGFFPRSPLAGEVFQVADVALVDVDGDGDMDVLSASYQDDKIAWFENLGTLRFTPHTITTTADYASSVFGADVDSDGDVDVLSASRRDAKVAWYENNGSENFTAHTITLSAPGASSVSAEDLDGDGDLDVLSTFDHEIAWYENDGNETFTAHTIAEAWGPDYVSATDIDDDGDMDVLCRIFLEEYKGDQEIVWYENDGNGGFVAHTVFDPEFQVRSVIAEDVDGDGDMDVISTSLNEDTIPWYENDGNENFAIRHITTSADGLLWVDTDDIDGDGDMDVFASSSNGFSWYENDGNESFSDHSIDLLDSALVYSADIDGDGDVDAVSTSGDSISWHDNDGNEGFSRHTIAGGASSAQSVSAADVDGDGDMDALSASLGDNRIAWYENDGGIFTQHTITTSARGAKSVFSADLDGDGDVDVLSGSEYYGTILWHENDGVENFTTHTISAFSNAHRSVYPADMDADGDVDVLATTNSTNSLGDGVVTWYENDGDANFTYHVISSSAEEVGSVFAVDVDGDGDMDVLSGSDDHIRYGEDRSNVLWYENDAHENFTPHRVDPSRWTVEAVSAADLDGDGDVDLLSGGSSGVAWYKNDGHEGFTLNWLESGTAYSVMAVDVDGDGDLDIVSTGATNTRLTWNENDGQGNFPARTYGSNMGGVRSILAADMEGDGDLDMLSAANPEILWYEHIAPIDYGDAPESYGTTLGANGPRHTMTGPVLGSTRDPDPDGTPTVGADGDDGTYEADEDGVSFDSLIIVGHADRVVTVDVQDAPGGAKLDAWIDFDANGTFDPGDQIADSIDVVDGENEILFNAPDTAVAGQTYARFRLSAAGDLEPAGAADDGEVEDYVIHILSGPADFGDAPDSYATTLSSDAGLHVSTGPRLGYERDTEPDGLPSTDANGDDANGEADEDGVTFVSTIAVGQIGATVTVNVQNAPTGAHLDAWIDFNRDGRFGDNERIVHDLHLPEGNNLVDFDVPDWALAGKAYARCRLSSAGGLGPTGVADDGEVEDYVITILANPTDFGDLPDEYGTTLGADGARHEALGPMLGASRDTEPDGLPSSSADGDDADDSDDEDGVTFASGTFVAAATVNIQNSPSGAKLDAWIDFDRDGSFDGPGEQIANSRAVAEGDNLVAYTIPLGTVPGETYARFRLSSAGGLAPTGAAGDGEVEDYVVTVIPVDTPYYLHTETVDVGYGVVSQGRLPADVGDDYVVHDSRVYYRQGNECYVTDADNVGISSDQNEYRTEIVDNAIVVEQRIDGEWLAKGECALPEGHSFEERGTLIDGDTIAVVVYEPYSGYGPDGPWELTWIFLLEQVDGTWQIVHTIERTNIDDIEFKNGTLGIASSSFYYTPYGWTSHAILSPGRVGLWRKYEGEWKSSWFVAEVTDQLSHITPDTHDGFGTDVFVGGTRAVGTGEQYCLDFRWNETTGKWGRVGLPEESYFSSIQIEGDVLVYSVTGQPGVVISQRSGEQHVSFEGDVGFVAGDEQLLLLGVSGSDQVYWYDLSLENETEESLVPVKQGGEISVSTSGPIIPTIEIYDPAGQLVAGGENGSLTYVTSSAGVYTVKTTAPINQSVSYDVSILSEVPPPSAPLVADYLELIYALPPDRATLLSLEAARDGHLTILGREQNATDQFGFVLLDQDKNVLMTASPATADASGTWAHDRRLDYLATAGESFYLMVLGDGSQVDLRICNLVSQTGDSVEIFDTYRDDAFLFGVSDTFDVTANGVDYHFDDATTFTFTSTTGQDTIELVDSDGDDTLTVSASQMAMSGTTSGGTAFSATAEGFRYAHGYAKTGGNDVAQFTGSEQSDRLKTYPDLVKLMGGGYFSRAKFFETVAVDMAGGGDTAVVSASDGADVVWAKKDQMQIAYDVGVANGAEPAFGTMAYDVTVTGCEWVVARAKGTDDWIELHDSALNDVLIAKPLKVEIMNGARPADGVERGAEYRITARGYRHVAGVADQGGEDSAKLYDSSELGVDHWAAGYLDDCTWSSMTSPSGLICEVLAFEQVGGYGFNGGLGWNRGTNRKDYSNDVDFVFEYGYWEAERSVRR